MEKIDLLYTIPMLLSVISFVLIFIRRTRGSVREYDRGNDKSPTVNNWLRPLKYLPILSVIMMLVGVIIISEYYEGKLEQEELKFNNYQLESKLKELDRKSDSIYMNNVKRLKYIDSLKALNVQYQKLLKNIKKQEKIIGKNSDIKSEIKEAIEKTNDQISTVSLYNQIIKVPKTLTKGHTSSGETSNFIFTCPNKSTEKYIDISLRFQNENFVDEIACIYIESHSIINDKEYSHIFSQAYLPQKGVNLFRIKNYQNEKNAELLVGYILKSDIDKDFPRFHKIRCK